MHRLFVLIALASSLGLGGCGIDSYASFWPDALKDRKPQHEIEQPPNVKAIIGGNLSEVFFEGTHPRNVEFSFPVPAQFGGWTTCIRASVDGIMGRALGRRTYLVTIDNNQVQRRELIDEKDDCKGETFQPL